MPERKIVKNGRWYWINGTPKIDQASILTAACIRPKAAVASEFKTPQLRNFGRPKKRAEKASHLKFSGPSLRDLLISRASGVPFWVPCSFLGEGCHVQSQLLFMPAHCHDGHRDIPMDYGVQYCQPLTDMDDFFHCRQQCFGGSSLGNFVCRSKSRGGRGGKADFALVHRE